MKLLFDTHMLIWAAEDQLPAAVAALVDDADNSLIFSVVSIWEIVIKTSRGRSDFDLDPSLFRRILLENGYEELPVLGRHAIQAASLPNIHKDPFDRLLVAQAAVEGITLLTADPLVAAYPGPIRKV